MAVLYNDYSLRRRTIHLFADGVKLLAIQWINVSYIARSGL